MFPSRGNIYDRKLHGTGSRSINLEDCTCQCDLNLKRQNIDVSTLSMKFPNCRENNTTRVTGKIIYAEIGEILPFMNF